MSAVLLIVAHPDDEVLWMGGTLQKLISKWKKVSVLLLSRPWNARALEDPQIRLWTFRKTVEALWVNEVFYENFPDTCFDTVRLLDIIKSIERVIDIVKPEIVYTHFFNDINIDHCIASRATITALRPIGKYTFVKDIFLFEVASSTELRIWNDVFIPNYYEDIGDFIDGKKRFLSLYTTELRDFPHPFSQEWVETLAKYRWMESWLSCAEAFILYRSRR